MYSELATALAPSRLWVQGAEPPEQRRAVVMVHVDHGQVRVPLGEDRLRLGQAVRRPNNEQAVTQRQLDEVHQELTIVEHERAACFDLWCAHVAKGTTASAAPVGTSSAPCAPLPNEMVRPYPADACCASTGASRTISCSASSV